MNDSPELDLYALQLVRLVAKYRGFTAASHEAGISQSALTRQVQAMEVKIGVDLFERTTRKVEITEAGAILLRETEALPNILAGALRRIREDYLKAAREISIGLSTALAHAHIPGIFHGQQREHEGLKISVSQTGETEILQQIASSRLDLGIVVEPEKIPPTVSVAYSMDDQYCLVVPAGLEVPAEMQAFREWVKIQSWLLPRNGSRSRKLIEQWAKVANLPLSGAIELESVDLMNQFVALGMGVALVPRRSLSGLPRKHQVQKVSLPCALSRRLVVLTPKYGKVPEHVQRFVEGILFS